MKNLILITYYCFISILLSGQNAVPAVFVVMDMETNKRISGAMVSIKQANWDTKQTDTEGKARFNNVPVGQIDYNVSKEGYDFFTSQVNVSSEIKNNTFQIGLFKKQADAIFISGKVTDANETPVKNAQVIVRINEVERQKATDETGYYSLDIVPNKKFPASLARIEIIKDGCKTYSDIIEMNGGKTFYKNYKLICEKEEVITETGYLAEKSISGIKFSVKKVEQKGSTALVHFTIENTSAAQSIKETGFYPSACELIDQEGNTFKSEFGVIGNNEDDGYVGSKFIYGTPVKGYAQFDVNAVKLTKVALFKVHLYGVGDLEFVNLKVNR